MLYSSHFATVDSYPLKTPTYLKSGKTRGKRREHSFQQQISFEKLRRVQVIQCMYFSGLQKVLMKLSVLRRRCRHKRFSVLSAAVLCLIQKRRIKCGKRRYIHPKILADLLIQPFDETFLLLTVSCFLPGSLFSTFIIASSIFTALL